MNVNRPSNMYMGEMQSTPYTDLGEFGRTPGAYATGSRNRMPNATAFPSEGFCGSRFSSPHSIAVGIPRVFDGSSAGEGFFGGAVSRTFSHGTTNPTEARRIMVAAKIIQPPGTTPFHAQWIEGTRLFCQNP